MKHWMMAGAVLAASLAGPASAATYSDQASFLAANPGLGLVSFEGQVTGLGPVLGTSWSFGGLDFAGNVLRVVDTAFWGSVDSLLDDRFSGFIEVSGLMTDAIGFFFASNYSSGTPIAFTAYNGANVVFASTLTGGGVNDSFAYFGLDGVGTITRIRLDSSATFGFASIAEISANSGGGVVPEPATWAMLIAGFGLTGLAARRRRATVAA